MKRIVTLLFIFAVFQGLANNLNIQNAQVGEVDVDNNFAMVNLDLSWENSWRDAENYDAVWLFVKYRPQGSTDAWQHARLATTGHQMPMDGTIETSDDGLGIFVYRESNGSGTTNFTNLQLRWEYGLNGVADASRVDIRVLGLEMVYVPQGNFWLGDGENRAGNIYGNFEDGNSGNPLQITSEAALTLGGGTPGSLGNNNEEGMYCCGGELNGTADDFNDGTAVPLPADFPKGFEAFFAMKYELSQAAWVTFLNMLDATQAAEMSSTSHFVGRPEPFGYYRYGITGSHPNFSTTEPFVPMIYMSWVEGAAFADWAGLRPMTEMEFEKACRGPLVPVMGEFPFGTANVDITSNMSLNNTGMADEGVSTGYTTTAGFGNLWVRAGDQDMETVARCGIFAANNASTGRETAGSTYWGLMEMGGNCWERCVSVGHPEGRAFNGVHGDGNLLPNGRADVANWPGQTGNGVQNNNAIGYRGGALEFPEPNLERNSRTSSRRLSTEFWNITLFDDGFRFVRTAL